MINKVSIMFLWDVIKDPEHIFEGSFRWLDVRQTAEDGNWPDGIEFKNQLTGKVVAYRGGELLEADGVCITRCRNGAPINAL